MLCSKTERQALVGGKVTNRAAPSPSYAVRAENDQGIRTYVDFRPKSSLQVGVWRGQWGGRMVGGAEAAGEVQAQAAQ